MYKLEDVFLREFYDENNKRMEELKQSIKDESLCFILGAGVSQSKGLPNWQKLLSKMIGRVLYSYDGIKGEKEIPSVQDLSRSAKASEKEKFSRGCEGEYVDCLNGINLLEVAEYLLNYFEDTLKAGDKKIRCGIAEKQMMSLLHYALYSGMDGKLTDLDTDKTTTLGAVAKVITSRFGEKQERQDVITYNYDDLLEKYIQLSAVNEDIIKSITYTDKDKKLEENKVNICHIHGKVSLEEEDGDSKHIILSESSYHDIEDVEYKWVHTVQVNAMLNNTCLFVGFSADDYNFRRIVRKSEKTGNSYILFAVDDFVKAVFGKIVQDERKTFPGKSEEEIYKDIFGSHDKYRYEKLMFTFMVHSKTLYWEKQKIKPIWTTLGELPAIIEQLV